MIPFLNETLASTFPFIDENKKLILVTGHRRESFSGGFDVFVKH